jgi:hypothetical protein
MKRFSAKGAGIKRIYTVGLRPDNCPTATLSGTPAVTVEVYDKNDVGQGDPDAATMTTGSAFKNAAAIVIEGVTVAINRAISQAIEDGVAGVVYVARFRCEQSDGQMFAEDVILPVSKYVPPSPP